MTFWMRRSSRLFHTTRCSNACMLLTLSIVFLLNVTHGLATEPIAVKMATDLSLSPDGKTLAFAWNNDLWSVSISGGSAARLTTDPARDSQPKFSPDGTQLAFVSDRSGSDQIYVMPATGGLPEQKTFHSEGYTLADWYPNGESVLAVGQRDHFWKSAQRMIQVNLKERTAEKVLLDDAANFPALSHDGTKILFVREGERWWRKGYRGERAGQIWLLNLATGETKELLHEGSECLWPMWMSDDSGFYFTKGETKGFDLWSYKFPRKESKPARQKQVAAFEDDSIVKPCISRDGSTIVFRHLFDLYSWNTGSNEAPQKLNIHVGSDIGAPEDRITTSFSKADDVAFTDDGLEIAFTAGGDLWVMDSELKEPIQVTKTDGQETSPIFANDGKSIYFSRSIDGQVDLWQVQRKNEDRYWWQQTEFIETQLTNTTESESNLKLTPDGKKLLFQKGRGDLAFLDLVTKDTILLVDGVQPPDYSISPDGHWIAYASQDEDFNSEIWLMPMDRNQPPVNVSRHPDNDDNPHFSPDGKLLAFTGRRVADESDIYYVYLREEDDDKSSRDRKLEKALEAMKKRKGAETKNADNKSSDAKTDTKDTKDTKGKDSTAHEPPSTEKNKDSAVLQPMTIDLDKIHERVRRINLPDTFERDLIFSADGKKLVFAASVADKSGWYSVEFPDKMEPKLMSSTVLSQARWTKSANGILGLNRGTPARLEGGEKLTDYSFSIQHERSQSGRMREGFNSAWRLMNEIWYDPAMGNNNWDAIRRKYESIAAQMRDEKGLAEVVELMLGELNGSHLGFTPGTSTAEPEPGAEPRTTNDSPRSNKTTAHLGIRFDPAFDGPGLRVRDVLPGGPADLHQRKLKTGDIVLAIDGKKVDPSIDLTYILNGNLERDIQLTVLRKSEQTKTNDEAASKAEANPKAADDSKEQSITIRPISYRRARVLLYDHWLEHNRELTNKLSDGKLGYLHIRAMDTSSLIEFERQLYNVGYGRDGLVIDVRDNGGGSTTDHLLTALTQPRHAITVPRGGTIGYPHDRMVYATWSKPIVVLCNQNSYSNAEIFSHAIKALGRGKLVGVQTAGGVVSTGVTRVTDVGVLRAPFRGWFSIVDGRDFELHGAEPDIVIWPKPGELPSGTDHQLEEALKVLKAEVEKVKPLPKPRYATEQR